MTIVTVGPPPEVRFTRLNLAYPIMLGSGNNEIINSMILVKHKIDVNNKLTVSQNRSSSSSLSKERNMFNCKQNVKKQSINTMIFL